MMRWIKTFGSLPFAVFLISVLAGILITSTALESLHGTPFAQKAFYEARWFDVFLGLLWVNIFCAALSRWPFQKRHTGFIVTHIGILLVLLGAFGARVLGAEGQMTLLEGERWNRIGQKGYDLLASPAPPAEGPQYQFHLPAGEARRAQRLKVPGSDLNLRFEEFLETAGTEVRVKDDGESYNPAVHFTIASDRAGIRQEQWLVARDPENPFSDQLELGPALFRIQDTESDQKMDTPARRTTPDPARLVLYRKDGEPIATVNLPTPSTEPVPIADGAFTLTDIRFLPYARVTDNKLTDDPASGKWNPAVEFTIADHDGREEKHTRFALFPDFDSLHGKTTPNLFSLNVELRAPEPAAAGTDSARPSLTFTAPEDSEWSWRSVKRDGTEKSGLVKPGEPFQTGWMDMVITVDRVVRRAAPEHVTGKLLAGTAEAGPGCRVSYTDAASQKKDGWVLLSQPLRIETPAGAWALTLSDRSLELPFVLSLRDFRKVDYPGTDNPASFESDVTLFDKKKNVTLQRTIKMNEPLDYAGWRIFQSSYFQDPEHGEASVFSIAKNPGMGLTYAGSLILLTGVILLFYIKPFSSGANVH